MKYNQNLKKSQKSLEPTLYSDCDSVLKIYYYPELLFIFSYYLALNSDSTAKRSRYSSKFKVRGYHVTVRSSDMSCRKSNSPINSLCKLAMLRRKKNFFLNIKK
jgi:hypothetical protein